jgi:hypothetical protein
LHAVDLGTDVRGQLCDLTALQEVREGRVSVLAVVVMLKWSKWFVI